MLTKEYNHLLKCCRKIQSSSRGLRNTLDRLLSSKDRSFNVSFDGVQYDFFIPTTQEELQELENLKEVFIKKLLLRTFEDMIQYPSWDIMESTSCWDNILIFAMGNPIEDYQIEKIKEENVYEVTDSQSKIDDGIAINEDSVYVQWQDQNKVKFEE